MNKWLKTAVFIALTACHIVYPSMASSPEAPADQVRRTLADAFEKKDIQTIRALIFDSYSGLRWFINETDARFWKSIGTALRSAKLKSSTPDAVTYWVTIERPNTTEQKVREVTINRHNDKWGLDLNSLLGPFPHNVGH